MTKEVLEQARKDTLDTLKSMEDKNDSISLAIRWGLMNNLRDIDRRLEAMR